MLYFVIGDASIHDLNLESINALHLSLISSPGNWVDKL